MKEVSLDHVSIITNGGPWKEAEFANEGVTVIKVSNMSANRIEDGDFSRIPEHLLPKYQKHLLNTDDLIVTTVGSHPHNVNSAAGRSITVTKDYDYTLLNQNAVFIRTADETTLNQKYLGYLGKSSEFKHFIQQGGRGAANQMRIPISLIRDFKFKLPPLPIQEKIASILSAYDDLIENNLKRIKLLKEAAQNLYREWFVEMRFPGHESAKFGEDGQPEGWEKVNLYDIAEIQMGFPFKADDFNEAGIGSPAIRIRDIPNQWTSTYTTQEAKDEYKTSKGDIVVGMDGFFYTDVWCGQDNAYLVQRVCRLRANDPKLQGYLLEALKGPIEFFEKTISGATVAHLGAKHLKEIFITQPITETQKELEVFNSLMQLKIKLRSQIVSLKEARDILLPRLMNQTIEV